MRHKNLKFLLWKENEKSQTGPKINLIQCVCVRVHLSIGGCVHARQFISEIICQVRQCYVNKTSRLRR